MDLVKVDTADHVAVVTMANPPANLFTGELATHYMQHAVELLLTTGARKFMANHDQLISFQGR